MIDSVDSVEYNVFLCKSVLCGSEPWANRLGLELVFGYIEYWQHLFSF